MCPHEGAVTLLAGGHQCGDRAQGRRGAGVGVRGSVPRAAGRLWAEPLPRAGCWWGLDAWSPVLVGLPGWAAGCGAGPSSAMGSMRPVWARGTGVASPESHIPSIASPTAVPRTSIAAGHGGAGARREGVSAGISVWGLCLQLGPRCLCRARDQGALGRCETASTRGEGGSAQCCLPAERRGGGEAVAEQPPRGGC